MGTGGRGIPVARSFLRLARILGARPNRAGKDVSLLTAAVDMVCPMNCPARNPANISMLGLKSGDK
jgi:hypothetical protein